LGFYTISLILYCVYGNTIVEVIVLITKRNKYLNLFLITLAIIYTIVHIILVIIHGFSIENILGLIAGVVLICTPILNIAVEKESKS
jgi:hypothetical protein